jgi:hypothetical protein
MRDLSRCLLTTNTKLSGRRLEATNTALHLGMFVAHISFSEPPKLRLSAGRRSPLHQGQSPGQPPSNTCPLALALLSTPGQLASFAIIVARAITRSRLGGGRDLAWWAPPARVLMMRGARSTTSLRNDPWRGCVRARGDAFGRGVRLDPLGPLRRRPLAKDELDVDNVAHDRPHQHRLQRRSDADAFSCWGKPWA